MLESPQVSLSDVVIKSFKTCEIVKTHVSITIKLGKRNKLN